MHPAEFTHQLVLRRNIGNGIVTVGWARDMPLDRYTHIAVVAERQQAGPLHPATPDYPLYDAACRQACAMNQALFSAQRQTCMANGWCEVPLQLRGTEADARPDRFGSYQQAAMHALHRLTQNLTEVWAALQAGRISEIRAQTPPRPMEGVEYQVWKHHTLHQLQQCGDYVAAGKLVINHTGLWFVSEEDQLRDA